MTASPPLRPRARARAARDPRDAPRAVMELLPGESLRGALRGRYARAQACRASRLPRAALRPPGEATAAAGARGAGSSARHVQRGPAGQRRAAGTGSSACSTLGAPRRSRRAAPNRRGRARRRRARRPRSPRSPRWAGGEARGPSRGASRRLLRPRPRARRARPALLGSSAPTRWRRSRERGNARARVAAARGLGAK